MQQHKNPNTEARLEKRKAILAALAKATAQPPPLAEPVDSAVEDNDYYTLTPAEMEALITGDMEKIESWVSNLDRRHATLLLRWLIKESR
jgi:hypothetical protein